MQTATLTRAPGRRRLPPGRARLRRRLTPLAAGCCARVARSYSVYCPSRRSLASFASSAPGTREGCNQRRPASPAGLQLVDALREIVHETQERVVDDALLGERRLDVPAHELPQDALHLERDPSLRPRPPLERLVRAHRPEALREAPRRCEVARPAIDGLPQPRIDLVHGKLLVLGHSREV